MWDLRNWMGIAAGAIANQKLTDIAIPGTHNSGSFGVGGFAPWVRCQDLDIRGQLHIGVRFFDLRVTFADGQFLFDHNSYTASNQIVEEALLQIATFLQESPTEILILNLSLDFDDVNDYPVQFWSMLNKIIGKQRCQQGTPMLIGSIWANKFGNIFLITENVPGKLRGNEVDEKRRWWPTSTLVSSYNYLSRVDYITKDSEVVRDTEASLRDRGYDPGQRAWSQLHSSCFQIWDGLGIQSTVKTQHGLMDILLPKWCVNTPMSLALDMPHLSPPFNQRVNIVQCDFMNSVVASKILLLNDPQLRKSMEDYSTSVSMGKPDQGLAQGIGDWWRAHLPLVP